MHFRVLRYKVLHILYTFSVITRLSKLFKLNYYLYYKTKHVFHQYGKVNLIILL